MTLDEALARVHPWLGTWKPGESCRWCSLKREQLDQFPCQNAQHDAAHERVPIPMPPATDELAMRVLRKGKFLVRWHNGLGKWTADTTKGGSVQVFADDPRDAIIIAAASWLQSQEKQKE